MARDFNSDVDVWGQLRVIGLPVATKHSQDVGDGSSTSIAVTHSLGTKDVIVSVRQNSDDAAVQVDWTATSTSQITLSYASAPASNAHRVTVIG